MVLMCQPVIDAVAAIEAMDATPATRIIFTPAGEKFSQRMAEELSKLPRLLLIAGHYEGFDQRIFELLKPREISIGDYVLSGGELPAMVLMDAVVRLIPGVLGDELSPHGESFGAATEPSKADWNIRSTPSPGNFRASACRRFCFRHTTRRSKNGAANKRGKKRPNEGRICWLNSEVVK